MCLFLLRIFYLVIKNVQMWMWQTICKLRVTFQVMTQNRKTLNIEIEIYLCVSEWMSYWNTAPCGFISHQYCNFFFVVCLCPLKTFTENLICVYSKCDDSHGRAKTTTEMHKILSSCHVLLLYFPDILYVPSTTIYVTNMAKVTHNST